MSWLFNRLLFIGRENSILQWTNIGHLSIQKINITGFLILNRLHGNFSVNRQFVRYEDISLIYQQFDIQEHDVYSLDNNQEDIYKIHFKYFDRFAVSPAIIYKKLSTHVPYDIIFCSIKPYFLNKIRWSPVMKGNIKYYHGLLHDVFSIETIKEVDDSILKLRLRYKYYKGELIQSEELSILPNKH